MHEATEYMVLASGYRRQARSEADARIRSKLEKTAKRYDFQVCSILRALEDTWSGRG